MADRHKGQGADLRRHSRVPIKTRVDLHWEGQDGTLRVTRACCLDVSESGIRLEVFGEVPKPGTSLYIRVEEFGFADYGTVRFAQARGVVGVEFRFDGTAPEHFEHWKKIIKEIEGRLAQNP
jgi:hypothetical protein